MLRATPIDFIKKQITPKPSFILYTLLAFLFLNAFWLVASQWTFVFRPYINYDYGLAFLLAPFSIVLCALALLVAFGLELFITNSLVFHFDSPMSFLRSSVYINELQLQDFLNWQGTFLFLSFLGCAVACAWFLKKRTNAIAAIIVVILAFGADQMNGSSYLIKNDDQLIQGNVAGSSMLQVYTSFKEKKGTPTPASRLAVEELPMPAKTLVDWADKNPDKSILFVIVESMGANKDKDADLWLRAQLQHNNLKESYDIDYGTAKFQGATTSAELRHLCGLGADYSSELTPTLTENCTPRIFASKGYNVVGAHGFSGNMFRRNEWWPMLGFAKPLFVQSFNKMDAPYCGSGLYGTCDDFIIRNLANRTKEEKGFYYQLTLNTHLPIVETPIPQELQEICDRSNMTEDACTLNAKAGAYLLALADAVSSLPNKPYIFIVGDHSPPFSGKTSRQNFSNKETPYFILMPRPTKDSNKK